MIEEQPQTLTLSAVQGAGFPMGGENLAVDLADTVLLVGDGVTELLPTPEANSRFWELHSTWLPPGWQTPPLDATLRLRQSIRSIFDALIHGDEPSAGALASLNKTLELATVHWEIKRSGDGFIRVARWHAKNAEDLPLAAAAASAIEFLASPSRHMLRRCASPACSMLYFTGDARRRWCTPNICGNRDRAARHYRRHRAL